MKIRDVLRGRDRAVQTIEASASLAEAIQRFGTSKIRALVVTEAEGLVGMLAIRDVLARLEQRGAAAFEEQVTDAMTREVVTVDPQTPLEEAHRVFVAEGINHLPVVEDGMLLGLVTPFDVLGSHVEDIDRQRVMLQAYITNSVL